MKALMFGNVFVDVLRLDEGIFEPETPCLFPDGETIQSLIVKQKGVMDNLDLPSEAYIFYLLQCRLANVEITEI